MMQHFDEISGITPQSGSHDRRSSKGDLDRVLNQLKEKSEVSITHGSPGGPGTLTVSIVETRGT